MAEEINQVNQSTQTEQIMSGEKPNWLIWILVIIGIVAVITIGLVVFLFASGDEIEKLENIQGEETNLETSVSAGETADSVPEVVDTLVVLEEEIIIPDLEEVPIENETPKIVETITEDDILAQFGEDYNPPILE